MSGKHHTKKAKRKIGGETKKKWQNPGYRERVLKAMFKSFELKPTKPERELNELLQQLFPNQYKYVGDGSVLIGYKNPDFINVNGQKKIIEMYGDYWHSEKITRRTKLQEERQRINHFAKHGGYQTLIIWEHELENKKQLRVRLERKLKNFNHKV